MVKEFAIALEREMGEEVEEELLDFTMGDDPTKLYLHLPGETELTLIAGSMSQYAETGEQAAAIMELFWGILDRDSMIHLRRRVKNRNDPFGIADIFNILEWVVEETTGRPTKPSSASTRSPGATGAGSTGNSPRKASTRSRSRQIDSAT